MQLSDIRTRVRYYLREDTANVWADAELTNLINLAQRYVVARLDHRYIPDNVTAKSESAAAGGYTLPSDFVKMAGDVTYQASAESDMIIYPLVPIEEFQKVRAYGTNHLMTNKKIAYLADGKMNTFPTNSSGTVYYHYVQYPYDMATDGADADVNDSIIDLVIIKSAADALIKTRQLQESGLLLAQLDKRIEELNKRG